MGSAQRCRQAQRRGRAVIRSICSAFVNAPLFRKRSADAKLLWYALYLHQAQHMCGLMRLDLEHMALDACMPLERTRAALVELIQHKLCQVDTQQELVCVVEMTAQAAKIIRPNWTGYKAVDKYLASLGASPLCKTVCDTLSIPYRYPIDTPPDTVPDTLLLGSDTGSESDPDTALSNESDSAPAAQAPVSPAPGLPGIDPGTPEKPSKPPKAKRAGGVTQEVAALAIELLGELNAARRRVKRNAPELSPTPENVRYLQDRLMAGTSPDVIRHVIAVREAQARHDEKSWQFFNAVSPFRPDNFAYAAARTVEDAAKPDRARGAWRDPTIGSNTGKHTPEQEWDAWRRK